MNFFNTIFAFKEDKSLNLDITQEDEKEWNDLKGRRGKRYENFRFICWDETLIWMEKNSYEWLLESGNDLLDKTKILECRVKLLTHLT